MDYERIAKDKSTAERRRQRVQSPGSVSRILVQRFHEETALFFGKKKKKQVQPPVEEKKISLPQNFWLGADAARDEKGTFLILSIRDFIIYFVFLSLVMIIAYGPKDNHNSYYEGVFSDLITKSSFETSLEYGRSNTTVTKTFRDVRSIRQLWDFINEVLVKVIYMDPIGNRILLDNIFIGAPTIRQIRVKKDTCKTAPMFQDMFKTCYDVYSAKNEDKQPIGDGVSTPWLYSGAASREFGFTRGIKSDYPSGGYTMNFTLDASFTKPWLKELETKHWIGPGTRAVIIDFALYTPNANLFLIVKLLAEVLPEGGVKTRQNFITMKIMRYLVPLDYFVLSCELIFLAFTIYFTIEEADQIWILRKKYLSNWWNVLDLTIIGLSYLQTIAVLQLIIFKRRYKDAVFSQIGTSNHASYYVLAGANERYLLVSSFLVFAVWLKIFKFSSLFDSFILLEAVTERIKGELWAVSFILLIIFVGFSIVGFCLFGQHVKQYQDISHSYISVVSMFVGRLYYINELLKVQGILAKLFIGAYCLIVVGVFMSTYVALFAYASQQTQSAYEGAVHYQFMGELVYSVYINLLVFCRRSTLVNIYRMKDQKIRNKNDYDAFLDLLKRYGWPMKELQLFLKFHGIFRGNDLNLDKLTEVYNDFWLRNQLFIEVQAHDETQEQLDKIVKTLDFCEQTIVDVMSRADLITDKATAHRARLTI